MLSTVFLLAAKKYTKGLFVRSESDGLDFDTPVFTFFSSESR